MEENQPESAATSCGCMGSDRNACPRGPGKASKRCYGFVEEWEQVHRDTTSQTIETLEKLQFEAWPDFRHFRIWQMNFRSEVSSCEIEFVKFIVDLKTSFSITGAKLQTDFEALNFWTQRVLSRSSTETSIEKVLIQEEAAQRGNTSHSKASRMYVLWVFQCRRRRRNRHGPQWDCEGRSEEWQRTVVQYAM